MLFVEGFVDKEFNLRYSLDLDFMFLTYRLYYFIVLLVNIFIYLDI